MALFEVPAPLRSPSDRKRVFRLVHWPDSRAVTVRIWQFDGDVFADVTGPLVRDGNSFSALGTLGQEPLQPDAAIVLALLEAELHGCAVVVDLDNPALWDPRWGRLVSDTDRSAAARRA